MSRPWKPFVVSVRGSPPTAPPSQPSPGLHGEVCEGTRGGAGRKREPWETYSPAFVPFLLWVHLGVGGCVSEGTPAGAVPVTFRRDFRAWQRLEASEPALPRSLGLGSQWRRCVLIAFKLLPAGSCHVHPDAGTWDVPVTPTLLRHPHPPPSLPPLLCHPLPPLPGKLPTSSQAASWGDSPGSRESSPFVVQRGPVRREDQRAVWDK